jgi:hypothetical protein
MPTVVIAASIIHVLASAFRGTTFPLAGRAEAKVQRAAAVTVAAVVPARHVC